jgi:hypothetical protein
MTMDATELKIRFTYHALKDKQSQKYETIRSIAYQLGDYINKVCPNSREQALAITALEEAVMWANAAIARGTP